MVSMMENRMMPLTIWTFGSFATYDEMALDQDTDDSRVQDLGKKVRLIQKVSPCPSLGSLSGKNSFWSGPAVVPHDLKPKPDVNVPSI